MHHLRLTALLTSATFLGLLPGAAKAQQPARTPLIRVEASLTDTGYEEQTRVGGGPIRLNPEGYELGFTLTGGAIVNQRHELSLSTGYTEWNGSVLRVPGVGSDAIAKEDAEQIPALFNYRFHHSLTPKLSIAAGPTAGFIYERITGTVAENPFGPGSGIKAEGKYTDSGWKFAAGATITMDYAISERWSITTSAQVLRVASSKHETVFTTAVPYDAATRVAFSFGASCRW